MVEYYPMHSISGNSKTATPVQIGDVTLGESPSVQKDGTQPNPIKITWSKSNAVEKQETPYPKYKTLRTGKETLYTLTMNFKTFRKTDYFDKVLELCENVGPHYVKTSLKNLWMYITDYDFTQVAEHDDDYVEWNLTLLEVND